jgi:hypothetical protein
VRTTLRAAFKAGDEAGDEAAGDEAGDEAHTAGDEALVLKMFSLPPYREPSTARKPLLTGTYVARSEGLEPPTF